MGTGSISGTAKELSRVPILASELWRESVLAKEFSRETDLSRTQRSVNEDRIRALSRSVASSILSLPEGGSDLREFVET